MDYCSNKTKITRSPGNMVTFRNTTVPQASDILLASYRVSVTIKGVSFVDMKTPAGVVNGSNASFTLSCHKCPVRHRASPYFETACD